MRTYLHRDDFEAARRLASDLKQLERRAKRLGLIHTATCIGAAARQAEEELFVAAKPRTFDDVA